MNRNYLVIVGFAVLSAFLSGSVLAFDFDLKSVRTTISNPSTSHALINDDLAQSNQKTLFSLEPINNQRVGVFFDINDIEIGYSADIFEDDVETKTQDILLSYRKFKNSKITFNYQTLEGLQSTASNLSGNQTDQIFSQNTRSTKFELSGQHNFYTFNNKASLFEHFFLNRPKLSNKFDMSLSIVGAWSFKHVSLENKDNIVFQADFLNSSAPQVTKLISNADRVSLWLFNHDYTAINSLIFLDEKNEIVSNAVLKAEDFPAYFDYILEHKVLDASDARNHEITKNLTKVYFEPSNIYSLLDYIYFIDNKPLGVICCESVGSKISWSHADKLSLIKVADVTTLFLSKQLKS